jgi:hypothetical protein
MILLISAFRVARITGVSHQHLASVVLDSGKYRRRMRIL